MDRCLKKAVLVCIVLAGAIVFFSCSKKDAVATANQNQPLIVAMELAYPPFETKDSDGNPSGISVDFAREFGKSIGRDVKIVNTQWDGLIPSLQTGKVDMIVSSMTITPDREKVVDFSVPYAHAVLGILTNKKSGITKAEDLNQPGRTIAVKSGSTGFIFAEKNMPDAHIITLSDESACVTEVVQGKADGFFYDQLTIYRNWQAHKDTTKAVFVPFQKMENWGVAVKKGNTDLLTQLNDFIPSFRSEGGFDVLTQKYLSQEKKDFDKLGFTWFFDKN